MHSINRLSTFPTGASGQVHIVIDTPRGTRNKVKWDEKLEIFVLSHVLTSGASFPYDFGFIPGTCAADGDALDVLVLAEEPFFAGCLVVARLIGGIEAEQTQDDTTFRNDRLLAVPAVSRTYAAVQELAHLPPQLVDEVEQFFVHYNRMRGREFKPIRRLDSAQALAAVKSGHAEAEKSKARTT